MQKYKYFICCLYTALPLRPLNVQNLQLVLDAPLEDIAQIQQLELNLLTKFKIMLGCDIQNLNITGINLLGVIDELPVVN